MKKKIILCITGLAMLAMIVPSSAQAVTAAELQAQIDALMATLADLQSQLADLTGEPTGTVTGCTITSFDRNLKVGMSGDDVKCLQVVLNSASDTQLSAGVGSPGQETSYFGPKTKAAVIKFQEKYAADILAGYGLTSGTGYVGTTTRAKLNSMLSGGVIPPAGVVCGNGTCEAGETSTNCPADCPVPPTASGLTVSLAYDTPASSTIADAANANFTKFNLTAGSEGDVNISKIYVSRSGLSANADVENIKIVDAQTGEYKGSIGSLNVDNRAMISFVPSLVIPAGTTKTFYIRAGVVSATAAGKTIKLGITANSDIVSNATSVNGAPATGNDISVVVLDIGSITVSEDGTTSDSQPDVGDTDVIVLNWKAAAGATEPVTIETVTVKRTGTADASDTINIELYDVTNGKSLGTVANWSSEDKATWSNLNLVIGKGETKRFKIMLDVVGGVSATAQTVNVDMVDGTDCLVVARGNTYGFYVTPTSGTAQWASAALKGKGANPQTIQAGSLNVSKSASTPSTGNIAAGDDILLGVFDFEAKGEDIKITGLGLDFYFVDAASMLYTEVTNVSLYDENGDIAAGPKDTTTGTADRGGASAVGAYLDYTDTFIIPVGIHKYTVKAKIADAVSTGDTIKVNIDRPGTSIVAVGMTSNDSIVATPAADVAGNTLTVAGIDLNVETLAYPTGRNVAKGASDFVWATFALDAGTSGEDVNVTAITVTDTVGTGVVTDINNAELWADLTSANSARGDVYETRISSTEQWAVAARAFTLSQTITVTKGTFINIALVADADASATEGTHVFSIEDAGVTGSGASTGSALDDDVVTTNEQTMTIATYGAITVTKDSSAPTADILIGGKTSTLNVFRLAASNVEDMDLDSITLYVTGGNTVSTYYFYNGSTLIGTRPGGTAPRLDLVDGTVTVPANGNVKITVKAKMLAVDDPGDASGSVDNNTDVGATINAAGVVDLTGLASGQAITSTETGVAGAVHQLYKSRPYVTVAITSPSGTLIPSTQSLLAIFDVTAEDTEDITFEATADKFIVEISNSLTASATDGTAGIWYLKDRSTGTTLSSVNVEDADALATFIFEDATFTVPAGETKQLEVYGDTHEYTTTGNSIQLWLDDGRDDGCIFGIDGSTGGYEEQAIIFKGDMYAGAFTKPGS